MSKNGREPKIVKAEMIRPKCDWKPPIAARIEEEVVGTEKGCKVITLSRRRSSSWQTWIRGLTVPVETQHRRWP